MKVKTFGNINFDLNVVSLLKVSLHLTFSWKLKFVSINTITKIKINKPLQVEQTLL